MKQFFLVLCDITFWFEAGTVDGNTTKMVATGLFPNEFYGFRVIAVNESGESAPSKTLDVDTLEEPEEEEEEHMVSWH